MVRIQVAESVKLSPSDKAGAGVAIFGTSLIFCFQQKPSKSSPSSPC
jgi:hypothetical protein